jgi:hypothetical protein
MSVTDRFSGGSPFSWCTKYHTMYAPIYEELMTQIYDIYDFYGIMPSAHILYPWEVPLTGKDVGTYEQWAHNMITVLLHFFTNQLVTVLSNDQVCDSDGSSYSGPVVSSIYSCNYYDWGAKINNLRSVANALRYQKPGVDISTATGYKTPFLGGEGDLAVYETEAITICRWKNFGSYGDGTCPYADDQRFWLYTAIHGDPPYDGWDSFGGVTGPFYKSDSIIYPLYTGGIPNTGWRDFRSISPTPYWWNAFPDWEETIEYEDASLVKTAGVEISDTALPLSGLCFDAHNWNWENETSSSCRLFAMSSFDSLMYEGGLLTWHTEEMALNYLTAYSPDRAMYGLEHRIALFGYKSYRYVITIPAGMWYPAKSTIYIKVSIIGSFSKGVSDLSSLDVTVTGDTSDTLNFTGLDQQKYLYINIPTSAIEQQCTIVLTENLPSNPLDMWSIFNTHSKVNTDPLHYKNISFSSLISHSCKDTAW